VYHEMESGGESARICDGFSLDQLAGYLDGATVGAWSQYSLGNGIPSRLQSHFGREAIRPISERALRHLVARSSLDVHYPYLRSDTDRADRTARHR